MTRGGKRGIMGGRLCTFLLLPPSVKRPTSRQRKRARSAWAALRRPCGYPSNRDLYAQSDTFAPRRKCRADQVVGFLREAPWVTPLSGGSFGTFLSPRKEKYRENSPLNCNLQRREDVSILPKRFMLILVADPLSHTEEGSSTYENHQDHAADDVDGKSHLNIRLELFPKPVKHHQLFTAEILV